jgi:hypothetical protein
VSSEIERERERERERKRNNCRLKPHLSSSDKKKDITK